MGMLARMYMYACEGAYVWVCLCVRNKCFWLYDMMANWHSVLMLLMLLVYFIFVTVSLCQLSSPTSCCVYRVCVYSQKEKVYCIGTENFMDICCIIFHNQILLGISTYLYYTFICMYIYVCTWCINPEIEDIMEYIQYNENIGINKNPKHTTTPRNKNYGERKTKSRCKYGKSQIYFYWTEHDWIHTHFYV